MNGKNKRGLRDERVQMDTSNIAVAAANATLGYACGGADNGRKKDLADRGIGQYGELILAENRRDCIV